MPTSPARQPSRRAFINHSLAGLTLSPALLGTSLLGNPLLAPSQAGAQEATQSSPPGDDSAGWIDAHVHVWTPNLKQYPLAPQFDVSAMRPPSFTDAELFSHCRPVGVNRIVLVQMSFYHWDHSYMLHVMQANPGVFSGVGLIDHRSSQLAARINELAASGIRGFRVHPMGNAEQWLDDPGMAQLWQQATERGLAICPLINPSDIPHLAALCGKFPDTTVVVDHLARIGVSGSIEQEPLDELCGLARFPNVHVKVSAFYALGKKQTPYFDLVPMIRRVLDSFGPERLMWGSDCPYQAQPPHSYADSLAVITDHSDFLSTSDRQWILRGTAEKIFFA